MNRGRRGEAIFTTKEDYWSFVDRIKDKFFNLKNFEEIPETKKLGSDIDKIKHTVCKAYNGI